jgi:hypothetical protein
MTVCLVSKVFFTSSVNVGNAKLYRKQANITTLQHNKIKRACALLQKILTNPIHARLTPNITGPDILVSICNEAIAVPKRKQKQNARNVLLLELYIVCKPINPSIGSA